MKRLFRVILIILAVDLVFADNVLYSFIEPDKKTAETAGGIVNMTSFENIYEKALIFHDTADKRSSQRISFDAGALKLDIDYDYFYKMLAELGLEKSSMLIFATPDEKNKAETFSAEMKGRGITPDIFYENDSVMFIKSFKEQGSKYGIIVLFQDCPLLNKGNQKLIASILISIKKVLITLGIAGNFPGILNFVPSPDSLGKAMKEFFSGKNLKGNVTVNELYFNLRMAAVIRMQFKTEFLNKVKTVM